MGRLRVAVPYALPMAAACGPQSAVRTEDAGLDAGSIDAGPAPIDAGPSCGDILFDPQNCGECGHGCPASMLCIHGECFSSVNCRSTGCPEHLWCDSTTGVCRTGCASDADCGNAR